MTIQKGSKGTLIVTDDISLIFDRDLSMSVPTDIEVIVMKEYRMIICLLFAATNCESRSRQNQIIPWFGFDPEIAAETDSLHNGFHQALGRNKGLNLEGFLAQLQGGFDLIFTDLFLVFSVQSRPMNPICVLLKFKKCLRQSSMNFVSLNI